jgi:riboflavin-specific deaminase-like protein
MTEAAPTPQPTSDPIAPILGADGSRPFVVAQLGQSLDGRIATPAGESRWINCRGGLDHLHRLRAAVDAVVVGVGTVIADDPALTVRRVEGRHPVRVVIDPRGRAPQGARCLVDDGVRRIVIRHSAADAVSSGDGVEVVSLDGAQDGFDPLRIVDLLFERGLKRLLVEGGAGTVSRFIDAGAVDRLHVIVAPLVLGSGKSGLNLSPVGSLAEALRPAAKVHLLADGDVLFDCNLRLRVQGVMVP